MHTPPATDYVPTRIFHERYPDLHHNMHALRWELRFRTTNGLIDSGAVVERYADPTATRAALLISPTLYFAWLTSPRRGAA